MCCRCCGVTQQKCWVFGVGTLLLVLGLIAVIWWPTWASDIIYKALPLSATSATYEKWRVTPIPVYTSMYLYNWTNPEQVRTPDVKPHFEQLGPYAFREVLTKEDIVWHANKTVTYYANRTWYFDEEMSGGRPDDLITVPHLPSIAASNAVRYENKVIKIFFNNILNNHGGSLYQTHTAIEWLFDGFYDEFLHYAMSLNNSMTSNIESDHFAWFLNRNGSKEFEGTFTIHTGQGDLSQMGEIKYWKGLNHTGFYEGECGRINGSASDLWAPKRAPEEYISVYITDTCRIINLAFTGETVTFDGVEGRRYETRPDTFDNGQLNPDMACYCPPNRQPDNCPKTGATDLGPCAEGVPMYLSHANFMYADPSYAETVAGVSADPERDSFFIIMEPKLGIPLQVNAAVQVSIFMQSDNDITILRGIHEFYAPLFITSSKAKIDGDLLKQVRFALNLGSLGRNIGIGMASVGAALIILGIVVTATHTWHGQSKNIHEQILETKSL